jgi:hypothetical protein
MASNCFIEPLSPESSLAKLNPTSTRRLAGNLNGSDASVEVSLGSCAVVEATSAARPLYPRKLTICCSAHVGNLGPDPDAGGRDKVAMTPMQARQG